MDSHGPSSPTAQRLQRILDQHPLLNHSGLGVHDTWIPPHRHKERQRFVVRERASLLADSDAFAACLTFLRQITPRKTINRHMTSYGLKHVAEDWLGLYIANGTFIAAAIDAGFRYVRCSPDSPNAYFAMAQHDIARLTAEAHARKWGHRTTQATARAMQEVWP